MLTDGKQEMQVSSVFLIFFLPAGSPVIIKLQAFLLIFNIFAR